MIMDCFSLSRSLSLFYFLICFVLLCGGGGIVIVCLTVVETLLFGRLHNVVYLASMADEFAIFFKGIVYS